VTAIAVAALLGFCCSVLGPSPGSVTCLDLDVVLPVKLADKVAAGVDALLEEKGVGGAVQK